MPKEAINLEYVDSSWIQESLIDDPESIYPSECASNGELKKLPEDLKREIAKKTPILKTPIRHWFNKFTQIDKEVAKLIAGHNIYEEEFLNAIKRLYRLQIELCLIFTAYRKIKQELRNEPQGADFLELAKQDLVATKAQSEIDELIINFYCFVANLVWSQKTVALSILDTSRQEKSEFDTMLFKAHQEEFRKLMKEKVFSFFNEEY